LGNTENLTLGLYIAACTATGDDRNELQLADNKAASTAAARR